MSSSGKGNAAGVGLGAVANLLRGMGSELGQGRLREDRKLYVFVEGGGKE